MLLENNLKCVCISSMAFMLPFNFEMEGILEACWKMVLKHGLGETEKYALHACLLAKKAFAGCEAGSQIFSRFCQFL